MLSRWMPIISSSAPSFFLLTPSTDPRRPSPSRFASSCSHSLRFPSLSFIFSVSSFSQHFFTSIPFIVGSAASCIVAFIARSDCCSERGTDRVHVGDAEAGVDASAATDEDDARQAQAPVSRCTVGVSTPRLLPRRARPLHRVPCPFSQEANPHELTTTWVLSCLTYVQDDGGRSTHRHTL